MRSALASGTLALLLLALPGAASASDGPVVVKGLVDMEMFDTDDGSLLLSRNGGDPGGQGRLRLLAAGDFGAGFQAFAIGRVEGGDAMANGETEVALDQAFVRFTFGARKTTTIDAGKITAPFGNFSKRYLSNVNPLIGHPDSYDVSYPIGVVLSGGTSRLDWRAAVIDKPLANEKYVPEGSSAARPALAFGVTPLTGFRTGVYWTRGPYLGTSVDFAIPAGASWRDYEQEVAGLELAVSHGYFELNGDVAFSTYEVPGYAEKSRGTAWFVEPKYTFTPRLFAALRFERNDYPYIAPLSPDFWLAVNAVLYDAEVGVGWRFSPGLIVKASYRRDDWKVAEADEAFFPNGYAVALQLSYDFDVTSWLERPR
jgi:hypothetical protein